MSLVSYVSNLVISPKNVENKIQKRHYLEMCPSVNDKVNVPSEKSQYGKENYEVSEEKSLTSLTRDTGVLLQTLVVILRGSNSIEVSEEKSLTSLTRDTGVLLQTLVVILEEAIA
ncbi:hypothetical protein JTB14_004981 [Gonioctena quinquepunctata]|nr:hypothetical protein JTB14_004981 [Gonioctena quinquepunctata]